MSSRMKIVRESDGLLTISADKKLYSLESAGIAIIAYQRIKSAQVSFWTEEEWAKEVEKAKKKLAKQQALKEKEKQ
jgi:pantothenate synthetase